MKKLFTWAALALMLVACNRTETYTIEGSFDIPEQYQVGDTILTRGPIMGYVYLCDLSGTPIDSAEIIDEKFTLMGLADSKNPYFAFLTSDFAAGMLVIEPGQMKAVLGEPVKVTGTPTNDQITRLMEQVDSIGFLLALEMEDFQPADGQEVTEEMILPIYTKYSAQVNQMVESLYAANKDNLMGVYCGNVMTAHASSSAELEELMAPLSDFVKNSELLQQHLDYLRQMEAHKDGEDSLGN